MNILGEIIGYAARTVKRLAIFVLAAVVIAGVALICYDSAYAFVRTDPYETYDPEAEVVTIDIPEGSTSREIGELLKENGLIENVLLFRLKAKLTGAENSFQYGVYKIIRGMPDEQIMEVLKEGAKEETITITIPEGWSVRQIAAYMEELNVCLASEFLDACNSTEFDFDFYKYIDQRADREYLLEGYLWPDTYEIIPKNGAEGVIKRMLREFERKWEKHYKWQERAEALGLTLDEVITMASCIEREAMLDTERAKVATVLYNRNAEGMTWGLNCTVLYALGKEGSGDDFVSYDDLEVNSAYNTYRVVGFPVGPICNPGAASIEAALNPAEGDWLFFIGYEDGSGEHFFTNSYEEFLAFQNGEYQKDEEEYDDYE